MADSDPDGLCADDLSKAEVEASAVFVVFSVLYGLMFLALGVWCFYALTKHWKKMGRVSCSNNKSQVIVCLCFAGVLRALSFVSNNCVYEEVMRSFKDIFITAAYLLIVMFWIELQKFVRSMDSVTKLRPYLYAIMVVFAILRIMQSVSDLFLSSTLKNIFSGGCILVFLFITVLGMVYGISLLKKMGQMKKSDMKARLAKLTRFMILVAIVLGVWIIWYGIRTVGFGKKKDTHPWLWFYLKLIDKFLEWCLQFTLCLTMLTKAKKSADPKKNTRPRNVSAAAKARQQRMQMRENPVAVVKSDDRSASRAPTNAPAPPAGKAEPAATALPASKVESDDEED